MLQSLSLRLSHPRGKISFAPAPNSVSFYWLERHQAGEPLLGTSSEVLTTHSRPLASLFLLPGHLGHLFCSAIFFFFFSPRPLKTILAVSLSHPRVLEWYEIPRKVFKSQTLISLVLFLAMKISSQGYSPDSCWSVLLRILALLGGLFPSSLVRLSSAGLC